MSDKIVKVCKVHGGLTENLVYFKKCNERVNILCKTCHKKATRLWKKNNKLKLRQKSKEYYDRKKDDCAFLSKNASRSRAFNHKNKDTIAIKKKTYYQNNKEKFNKISNKRSKKETIYLEDRYIKRLLYRKEPQLNCSQHRKEDIDFLILAKRLQIKYYRIFNQPMRKSK